MRKVLLLGIIAVLFLFLVTWTPKVSAAIDCTFTTTDTTMTLDADCTTDATILIPDGFTLDGAGNTITALDPSGGHFVGAVVANAGTIAHVKNLTVKASALANVCDGGDDRLRGILFEGASGSIINNTVEDINQGNSGCQEGNGIEIRNAPFDGTHPNTQDVTIEDNIVTDYQKNGITANGDVVASITDNTVTGLGPVLSIAQNGIQVGFGAEGQVKRNAVVGSWFTGANWTASGVLVFESNGAVVQDNEVSGNQSGIVVEAWCWSAPSANNNKLTKNIVEDAVWGITVDSYAISGFTNCNPSADNNKVTGNTVTSSSGDIGIFVGTGDFDGESEGFTPSADNNKVIQNEVSGFEIEIDNDGTASKVHANVTSP